GGLRALARTTLPWGPRAGWCGPSSVSQADIMRLLTDPEAAHEFLSRDRPLGAWPLCFLGPADWPHARLWTDDATGAGLWVFDHPWWGGSVQAFGGPAALEPIFRSATLP